VALRVRNGHNGIGLAPREAVFSVAMSVSKLLQFIAPFRAGWYNSRDRKHLVQVMI